MLLDGEMGQVLADLPLPQILRVALSVEEDESADPADVGLLGSRAVAAAPRFEPNTVEQSQRLAARRERRRHETTQGPGTPRLRDLPLLSQDQF